MSPAFRIPHSRPTPVPGMVAAVGAVIESGGHVGGPVRGAFEDDLARRLGARHAVAVQSGSAALHLALLSLGVGAGDRVLAPSYACAALLNTISACGARAVLCDVDPGTFNVSAETALRALEREGLTDRDIACAIVPHMLGAPAPLADWDLACPVVEDCAMALGARISDEEVGCWGRVAVFSFYATKMISTGQGGMLVTNDDALAGEARDRIRYDERRRWRPAWNYPLTDLAAALGRVQLRHLDEFLRRRAEIAAYYRDLCRELGLACQRTHPDTTHCHFRFALQVGDGDRRRRLQRDLRAEGIEAKPPVYCPLHRYLELDRSAFEVSETVQERTLSLPLYPSLGDGELAEILAAVRRSVGTA